MSSSEAETIQSIKTGVQVSSELVIPGGSNLVKGDFRQAGIHAGLGIIARILFGLPGAVLVSTNSITKAITGRHLHEHLNTLTERGARGSAEQQPTPPPPPPRTAVVSPPRQATASLATPPAPEVARPTAEEQPLPAKKARTKSASKKRAATRNRLKT